MEDSSVIVTTRAEIAEIDLDAPLLPQLGRFDAAEMKWLDIVKLARLEEILGGPSTLEVIEQYSGEELVATSDEWEAFIEVVRPELTRRLAAVDDSNADEIARRWGATEELSLYPTEWLCGFIKAFVGLARQAVSGERQLFQVFY